MEYGIFETKFSYFHTHLTSCGLPRGASPCSSNLNFHVKRHLHAHLDLSLINGEVSGNRKGEISGGWLGLNATDGLRNCWGAIAEADYVGKRLPCKQPS